MPDKVTLNFGFLNTPYTKTMALAPMSAARTIEKGRRRHFTKTMTANQVADILESKYIVVETFSEIYEDEIGSIFDESVDEYMLEILASRNKFDANKLLPGMKAKTSNIEKLFRSYLDHEEMSGYVDGVPTAAALGGIKYGRKSRARRPSFVNTGIYRASFRAWVE